MSLIFELRYIFEYAGQTATEQCAKQGAENDHNSIVYRNNVRAFVSEEKKIPKADKHAQQFCDGMQLKTKVSKIDGYRKTHGVDCFHFPVPSSNISLPQMGTSFLIRSTSTEHASMAAARWAEEVKTNREISPAAT